MKTNVFFILIFLFYYADVKAQNYKEGRYISTTNHKIIIPEDGNIEEILQVSSEWSERVLKQSSVIKDIRYLLTYTESDTMNLLVLYEYESIEEASKSGASIQELINKNWPDEKERNEFFARFRKYINPNNNIRKSYKEIITFP